MLASFSIHADVPASMLRITMSGFFELPDIAQFAASLRSEHGMLRCGPNQHLTLVDMRGMKIQPQSSVDGFQHLLCNPATEGRRIAFVVEAGLARAQIQRAASTRNARYFSMVTAAEQWLTSDAPVPVAAPAMLSTPVAAMRPSLA